MRELNPDNPPASGQEVFQMSTLIQAASPGGGITYMHVDMDDFSYRQQDTVKLGTIVMSLYWIVTMTAEHSTPFHLPKYRIVS